MSESVQEPPTFEEGRYLYCAVSIRDEPEPFEASGIDGEDVSLLTVDDVGVLYHPVDGVYDSENLTEVRRWLLSHQQVVDDAGEAFGTPLPFRFDTILTGDETTVREWLESRYESIAEGLEWLSGRWEYRIDVDWDRAGIRADLVEDDPDLSALAEQRAKADEGTAYLLDKQLEREMTDRLRQRRTALAEEVNDAVAPHAVEVEPAAKRGELFGEDDGGVVSLSLLADRRDEEAIGQALERFATGNRDVRYTGPWPPYTFAPAVAEDDR